MLETYNSFKLFVKKYSRFFDLIDQIREIPISFTDRAALNYSDILFRPNLGGGASATIRIKHIAEKKIEFSEVRFVGSENRIAEIKNILQNTWDGWNRGF